MITYLEPDILECEVKWALESITTNKASGGDGIPVELRKWQPTPIFLPGKTPWTAQPGRLQSMELQRAGHD